jgi:hypothetical protein
VQQKTPEDMASFASLSAKRARITNLVYTFDHHSAAILSPFIKRMIGKVEAPAGRVAQGADSLSANESANGSANGSAIESAIESSFLPNSISNGSASNSNTNSRSSNPSRNAGNKRRSDELNLLTDDDKWQSLFSAWYETEGQNLHSRDEALKEMNEARELLVKVAAADGYALMHLEGPVKESESCPTFHTHSAALPSSKNLKARFHSSTSSKLTCSSSGVSDSCGSDRTPPPASAVASTPDQPPKAPTANNA